MFSFDVLAKSSLSGESIIVSGTFLDRAVMWSIILVRGCEMCLKIFNRIKRFLGRAPMNTASSRSDIIYKMGMSNFDVSVKFVFPWKSGRTASAARIRTVECVFLRMGFHVTGQVMLSRKPLSVPASRDITPMELHMKLEMSVEVGLVLERGSGFPSSAARPLAQTWSDKVAFHHITMVIQVLSKMIFTEERFFLADWPFATHWCLSDSGWRMGE